MRKRSGPKIEPWGTPVKTGLHDDVCPDGLRWSLPLNGTHLDAVRGLITKRFSPKCANKKSSSERRYFVLQELTDLLLYADARDLTQGRRN